MEVASSATTARHENGLVGGEEKKGSDDAVKESSTMKAAQELIASLDTAYSEMRHSAADAARDAENARRNARAASEIARRYLHRSYPKTQTQFGAGPSTPTSSTAASQELVGSTKVPETTPNPLQAINGLASELQTPREDGRCSFEPTPRSSRRTYNTPMSTDRIAQSHAEEILGLTMELERTRQTLKSEQRMHEEAKASLASYQSKHASLEEQNRKLLEELEQTKMEAQTRTSELEQQLQQVNYKVQAAEEDAQLALDIANDSDQQNLQLEDALKKAAEEIRILKEEKANSKNFETPKRGVRWADTTPPPQSPTPPQPPNEDEVTATPSSSTPRASREMVAAGRQLLRRRMGTSPQEEVINLELTPAKSAERRRRLRDRLTQRQQDDDVQATPAKSPQRPDAFMNSKLAAECRNSAKLLQQSGQRLDLGGHWWREHRGPQQPDPHLEAMTRQYCQSVEVSTKIDVDCWL